MTEAERAFSLSSLPPGQLLQDDDWGTPAEPKVGSGSKRPREEAAAPDAGAGAAVAVTAQEPAGQPAAAPEAVAATAAEAVTADDAPVEKRHKVRCQVGLHTERLTGLFVNHQPKSMLVVSPERAHSSEGLQSVHSQRAMS